jgi:hypothetical protein
VTKIETGAFRECKGLTSVTIGGGVTTINSNAFGECTALTSVTFETTSGWYVTETDNGDISTGIAVDLSDPANNATLLKDTYVSYNWYRS